MDAVVASSPGVAQAIAVDTSVTSITPEAGTVTLCAEALQSNQRRSTTNLASWPVSGTETTTS